ncbi:MAG TPA: DUF1579 family protein [Chitinophaga sp.]
MGKRFIIIALLMAVHVFSFAQNQNVSATSNQVKFPAPGRFHEMLARSNGTWMGEGTMQFSSEGQRVSAGASMIVNKMSSDGLYQISEVKGNIKPGGMGAPWTGLRITGYDNARNIFTRAMIGDGPAIEGVVMEGQWDEAKRSITFPFKRTDQSGKERILKEVYTIVDENTEVLEIYDTDPKTNKEFMMLQVKWMRQK